MRTDRKITLAVSSASLLVIAVAGIGLVSTRRLVRDAERVLRTHEIRAEFQQLARHIDAAESDARGFLLTADAAFLRRQRANVNVADEALQHLAALTAGDSLEQAHLSAIHTFVLERTISLEHTTALRFRVGQSVDELNAQLAIGEALTHRIDSLVDAADAAQSRILAARLAEQTTSERRATFLATVLVLMSIVLVGALGQSIRRDFVGRTRAEDALRASEAKFAGILSIAPDAIITIDAQQVILHFNRGAQDIFGYEEAEVLGKQLDLLIPAPFIQSHREHVTSFATVPEMARRRHERREIQGKRKNGEVFPAEASISKLMTPKGWIFTAMLRDITERKRLEHNEHALAEAGVQLERSIDYGETLSAVAALPVPAVGIWCVLDVVEETESGESTLRRIGSGSAEPVIDEALREWSAKGIDWDAPDMSIDVIRTGELQHVRTVSDDWLEAHVEGPMEIDIARRIGMHSLLIVPLKAGSRTLGAWTIGSAAGQTFDEHDKALVIALAERASSAMQNARLFQRTRRATEARDRVLSIVSHDLRNPLAAVSMLARRLTEHSATPEEQRSIGDHVLKSVDWMHRLMQDLLDASSIEAGKLSVEIEPQAIHQIVDAVMEMFAAPAAERGVTLRAQIPSAVSWVLADASRVIQLFGNLVSNALKFTPPGGEVTLGARVDGGEMLLWVRDTGAGIPRADLPRVFDRFWHARRSGANSGTGLGLAIAHGIVRAHGGRIWVESTVGEGSTFYFTIPMALKGASAAGRTADLLFGEPVG